MASRIAAAAAEACLQSGTTAVLDVYAPPAPVPEEAEDWRRMLRRLPLVEVYLLPTFPACQARNAGRSVTDRLDLAALRQNYADFEWSVAATRPHNVLDTTSMTPQETVSAMTELIAASRSA